LATETAKPPRTANDAKKINRTLKQRGIGKALDYFTPSPKEQSNLVLCPLASFADLGGLAVSVANEK